MPKNRLNVRSQTIQATESKVAKLEFKQNVNDEWYWTLTAINGRQIGTCAPEYYKNRGDCVSNAQDILLTKWNIED